MKLLGENGLLWWGAMCLQFTGVGTESRGVHLREIKNLMLAKWEVCSDTKQDHVNGFLDVRDQEMYIKFILGCGRWSGL